MKYVKQMFRKIVRFFYLKLLTNMRSGVILYSNSCSEHIFEHKEYNRTYGGIDMNYRSELKNDHIKYIYRRNEIRENIRTKINRKYDPAYIMMQKLKKAVVTFAVFAIITMTFALSSSFVTNAKSNHTTPKKKYYTTVEIKNGDTLTSIAKKYYYKKEYKNLDEYMNEIMELNRLESTTIHSGCYLKIAYFK